MLSEARLAADLLNVAKALLVRVATQSRVIAGQTASFRRILPLRMPLKMISLRLPSHMINSDRTDIRLLGQEHDQGRDSPSLDHLE